MDADVFGKFRFLSARNVLHFDAKAGWPVCARSGAFKWQGHQHPVPLLVIFCSHRWVTKAHPDPDGQQLAAVQHMLQSLLAVMQAIASESVQERVRLVPSLSRHGVLQALALTARFDWTQLKNTESMRAVCNELQDRIFLWYDYACLPQHPRDADEEVEFREALYNLNSLLELPITVLMALREEGDDFDQRAWCVSEISAARKSRFNILSQRTDSDAKTFTEPFVLRTDMIDKEFVIRQRGNYQHILSLFAEWNNPRSTKKASDIWMTIGSFAVYFEYIFGCDVGLEAQIQGEANAVASQIAAALLLESGPPQVIAKSYPIFEVKPALSHMKVLGIVIVELLRAAQSAEGVVDLKGILENTMNYKQLKCTNGSDTVRAALIMLVSLNDEVIWKQALKRALFDQSLVAVVRPKQQNGSCSSLEDIQVQFQDIHVVKN